nr:antibiotic biosynthesis monooxygenase [Halomonas sp. MCCC 1A13316]
MEPFMSHGALLNRHLNDGRSAFIAPTIQEPHMSQNTLFIIHKAVPGKRDEVRRAWETHLTPSIEARQVHDAYYYCYDDSDPDTIRVFQRYADGADPKAFMQGPAYDAYIAAVSPLLAHPPPTTTPRPMSRSKTWAASACSTRTPKAKSSTPIQPMDVATNSSTAPTCCST